MRNVERWRSPRRWGLAGVVVLLVGCSSSRDAGPIGRATPAGPTSAAPGTTAGTAPPDTTSVADTVSGTAASTSSTASTTSTAAPTTAAPTTAAPGGRITVTAVAGATGPVHTGGPPFNDADPFTEAVRLDDGTCVGWSGSRGGTTAGLEVGAPVVILDAAVNDEIGRGRIERSRWVDVSRGGRQWNCLFEIGATVTGSPTEFRIRVAGLQPWLAGPDPTAPGMFAASVSTNADIGLIPSCPPVPEPAAPETTAPRPTTTRPAGRVSAWHAVGRYWSNGLASLCKAGLAVTAIARPCRPPGIGSEYISEIVDSNDPTVIYRDGERVRRGTQVTVVVATGRPCE